jgi:hypothetical protein
VSSGLIKSRNAYSFSGKFLRSEINKCYKIKLTYLRLLHTYIDGIKPDWAIHRASPIFLTRDNKNWDRCYDFKNSFAKQIGEKIGVFDSKESQSMQKLYNNIGL